MLELDDRHTDWWMVFGLDIAPLVTAEDVLCQSVPEGTAADDVDPDEGNSCDDEDNIGLPPLMPKVSQEASLTGVAPIAELALVVAPGIAVWVSYWIAWVYPKCGIHIPIATHRRRLTAP